jgi:hypothetical protein
MEVRNERFGEVLESLERAGLVVRTLVVGNVTAEYRQSTVPFAFLDGERNDAATRARSIRETHHQSP